MSGAKPLKYRIHVPDDDKLSKYLFVTCEVVEISIDLPPEKENKREEVWIMNSKQIIIQTSSLLFPKFQTVSSQVSINIKKNQR